MSKRILCVIAARQGSKGLPKKNIKNFCGIPLLSHTIIQAKATNIFTKIAFSSDCREMLEIAKNHNIDYIINRPKELATDSASSIDVIKHACLESENNYASKFDIIINLQVTSPLRTSKDIIEAYHLYSNSNVNSIISASESKDSPYFNIVEKDESGYMIKSKNLEKDIVRRQDVPKCFVLNGAIYIWDRDKFMLSDILPLEKSGIYLMPKERSFDIDTKLDFEIAEFIAKKQCS